MPVDNSVMEIKSSVKKVMVIDFNLCAIEQSERGISWIVITLCEMAMDTSRALRVEVCVRMCV